MKTYALNRDWTMFSKGELFKKNDDGCTIYTLISNKTDNVLDVYRHISRNDLYVGAKVLCFTDNRLAKDNIEKHKENWLVYLGVKEKSGEES